MRKGKVPYQLIEVLSCPGGIKYFSKQSYYINFILVLPNTIGAVTKNKLEHMIDR